MSRLLAVFLAVLSFTVVGYTRSPSKSKSPGKPVAKKDRIGILTHWWERPYEYMFERGGGKTLPIRGRSYGMFTAGIDGIMKYGGLAGAVAKQLQTRKGGFSDLSALQKLSGLKIHRKRDTTGRTFSHFNKAIIRWGHHNLIPAPQERVAGHTCQTLYDVILARFFRLMAASHQHLDSRNLWRKEKQAYLKAMKQPRFDGIDFLQRRYAGQLNQYDLSQDGTNFTVPMAIGFWLRRHADGTAPELWSGLTRLLGLYDRAFLDGLRRSARSPKPMKRRRKKKRK